jgi:hypothetical protein
VTVEEAMDGKSDNLTFAAEISKARKIGQREMLEKIHSKLRDVMIDGPDETWDCISRVLIEEFDALDK